MDAEPLELCERLRAESERIETDLTQYPSTDFVHSKIARSLFKQAADTIAAQAAELEGVRAMWVIMSMMI